MITPDDRRKDSQALSDAIKEAIDRAALENRHVNRIHTICAEADDLAPRYPCAHGGVVFALVSQWVYHYEVDSLEERNLPGIIDDAIAYAQQAALSENAR